MILNTFRLPGKIHSFAKLFSENGFECFLVGGAVRNMVAGHPSSDWDFATDATPEEVISIFRRVIPTGIKHGTVTVLYRGERFEVTTFRIDEEYSDGRRPDKVTYTGDIFEDLSRRDFTINAMAINLNTGKLIDPHDGRGDIKRSLIRAIGDPATRFEEDGLRLLRACRFTAQLRFTLEEKTAEALSSCRKQLDNVSPERIRDEIVKMLSADTPSIGFKVMEKSGILADILPELARCRGIEQKGFHDYDVLDHSLYSCDGGPKDAPEIRLAALLHDTGKSLTVEYGYDGIPTFYRHEVASEEIAREIMERLRFSNAQTDLVCHLIRHHMFNYTPDWSDSAVRRFIARVGRERIDDLFALRRADQFGMSSNKTDSARLAEFGERLKKIIHKETALSLKDLAVNGRDLMEAGIPGGPVLGTVLEQLLETVLDDPEMNTKERLLPLAKNLYGQIG
jgi:poly(A) polymerase/tRNA nucleotidyltransferase (CCA-adding enzyme)